MKTGSTALQDELYLKNVHSVADLYTFTFAAGTQRWTTADRNISFGGNTWLATGTTGSGVPGIEREDVEASAGFEVGKLTLTIHPGAEQLAGEGMVRACLDRHFDDVPVLFERAFCDSAGTVIDTFTMFEGRAHAQPTSTTIKIEVRSAVDRLRRPFPHRVFQAGCPWAVYSTACGVTEATFTHARTAAAGSTAKVLVLSSSSTMAVPGSRVEFTSGALSGQIRTVIAVSGVNVTLQLPLTAAPAVGNAFNVIRGCDKRRTTCRTVFSNVARFGGYPDAPSIVVANPTASIDRIVPKERRATRYGDAVAVVYGKAKVPGTEIYKGAVQVRPRYHTVDYNSAFYGVVSAYGLAAPVAIAIAEAPITSVENVWHDGFKLHADDIAGASSRVVAYGTTAPAFILTDVATAWTHMNGLDANATGTTWKATAHVRYDWMVLKSDGQVPKLEFEVKGRAWNESLGGAHPADVVVDMLTHATFGFGLSASEVEVDYGSDGLAASSYRTYCTAMGFKVNRAITSREEAATLLEELMQATNSEGVWSEGKLKIVPLDDTATGAYTPPSSSVLLDADELGREGGEDPIEVERTPDEEVFNEFPVAVFDASTADFGDAVYAYLDEAHQADHGTRTADETRNTWITTAAQAHKVSQYLALRSINLRATYKFKLGLRWGLLDPLDYVTVQEPVAGVDTLCRIKLITESGSGADAHLEVEAWEWPSGVATAIDLTPQAPEGMTDTYPRDALVTADSKAQTYYQASAPASARDGDLWFDTDDGNAPYRYDGSTWQAVQDGAIATAQTDATSALTLAGSKALVTYSASAPASGASGDLWFNTDTTTNCPDSNCQGHTLDANGAPNVGTYPHRGIYWPHRWSGTAWVDGDRQALVVANEIAAGAVVADKIAANAITAEKLAADAIKTSNFASTGSGTSEVATAGAKMQADGTALLVAAGNLKVGARNLSELGLLIASCYAQITATPSYTATYATNIASITRQVVSTDAFLRFAFTNATTTYWVFPFVATHDPNATQTAIYPSVRALYSLGGSAISGVDVWLRDGSGTILDPAAQSVNLFFAVFGVANWT